MIDGLLLFAAVDPEHGLEMWRSDGTAAGHRRSSPTSSPARVPRHRRSFTLLGWANLFFVAGPPRFGYELWAIHRGGCDPVMRRTTTSLTVLFLAAAGRGGGDPRCACAWSPTSVSAARPPAGSEPRWLAPGRARPRYSQDGQRS